MKYSRTVNDLLDILPPRTRDIIEQRYGLFEKKRVTLESIGESYKITRERVRQIEKDGVRQLKKENKNFNGVFTYFHQKLNEFGGLKREDLLVDEILRGNKDKEAEAYILFLLNVCDGLFRFPENKNYHAFWSVCDSDLKEVRDVSEMVVNLLTEENRLLSIEKIQEGVDSDSKKQLSSVVEIAKKIKRNEAGLYGLLKWPEISPRGIKDKAYLIFKKHKKPLHFREVASLLGNNTNAQTTHNELIKDSRFVLIGRGVYALSEWGYKPGEVKEVIKSILVEQGALHKKDIIVRVFKQRMVKENTIVQNLSNKKHFIRTPDGKYTIA